MNFRPFSQILLIGVSLLSSRSFADQPTLTKAQELSEAVSFVSRLTASPRNSNRPTLGVLTFWDLRIDTYCEDYDKQLKRSEMYKLYYDGVATMEKLYKSKVVTYRKKDGLGYPSQITLVNFEDFDLGKCYLAVGLWEGNDSTGFYFVHLPETFNLQEGWEKQDS